MAKKTTAQIEFRAVTSEFTSGIKEVNSSLKTIQTEINQTSRRLEDLESSANNAEDDIESLSRELNDLGDSVKKLKNLLKVLEFIWMVEK